MKFLLMTVSATLANMGAAPPQDAGQGARVEIVAGSGQQGIIQDRENYMFAAATFAPLKVRVVDRAGRPLAGVTVQWHCNPAPHQRCLLTQGADDSTTSDTDANGVATLDQTFGSSLAVMFQHGDVEVRAAFGDASVSFVFPVEDHTTESWINR